MNDEEEHECQEPCHPDSGCPGCTDYWARMINEGFWDPRGKWTDKGWREITKYP